MGAVYLIGAILVAAAGAAGACAYSVMRRQRAASRDAALSAQRLYERGKRENEKDSTATSGAIGRALRDAGIDASPLLWSACVVALGVVLAAFANLAAGMPVAAMIFGATLLGAFLYVLRGAKRRKTLFSEQFVRLLPQLSASVKSSLTLERSLRVCADHASDPLRGELAHVLAQAAYGMALPDAFELLAERTGCSDARALASAMRVQSRFGGPLAAVLDSIADHANARMRLERELAGELAGTKLAQGFVACSMPAIFLMSYVLNSDFAAFYREEPLGWMVLGAAAVMEVAGVYACHRVTKCKHALA